MTKREVFVLRDLAMNNGGVARFVETANQFSSNIKISYASYTMNAKSLLGVINLCLRPGIEVDLTAEGPDEEVAVNMLEAILTGKY